MTTTATPPKPKRPPTKRERERSDAAMADLRQARAELDKAQARFEKAAATAYDRATTYNATEVAAAAGWSRPRLYQFLKNSGRATGR